MDPFDVSIDGGVFRISERRQPGGALSYDVAWIDGPADGTYGFTVGRFVGRSAPASVTGAAASPHEPTLEMTREELLTEVRAFVRHVDEPEGIGEDVSDRTPRPGTA